MKRCLALGTTNVIEPSANIIGMAKKKKTLKADGTRLLSSELCR